MIAAGRHHRRTGPDLPRLHRRRAACHSGPAQLPGLPQVHLHVGEPRGLPRHPRRQDAQAGRHRQRRHHRHQGRLSWRHQPDVLRRQGHDRRASGSSRSAARPVARASRRSGPARASATSATPSRSTSRRSDSQCVREYCGHGIGRVFHEDPQVLHYGEPGTGIELRPGMTFTIEPMVNVGKRARPAAAGRLDRRHPGSLAVGPVGTHRAGHRERLRGADPGRRRAAPRP